LSYRSNNALRGEGFKGEQIDPPTRNQRGADASMKLLEFLQIWLRIRFWGRSFAEVSLL
jgi:hypothetical protein